MESDLDGKIRHEENIIQPIKEAIENSKKYDEFTEFISENYNDIWMIYDGYFGDYEDNYKFKPLPLYPDNGIVEVVLRDPSAPAYNGDWPKNPWGGPAIDPKVASWPESHKEQMKYSKTKRFFHTLEGERRWTEDEIFILENSINEYIESTYGNVLTGLQRHNYHRDAEI